MFPSGEDKMATKARKGSKRSQARTTSKSGKASKARAASRSQSSARMAEAFAEAAPNPDDIIDIPPRDTFNQNLSSASERTMLDVFGVPGQKTRDCSPATGEFRRKIKTSSVGP